MIEASFFDEIAFKGEAISSPKIDIYTPKSNLPTKERISRKILFVISKNWYIYSKSNHIIIYKLQYITMLIKKVDTK